MPSTPINLAPYADDVARAVATQAKNLHSPYPQGRPYHGPDEDDVIAATRTSGAAVAAESSGLVDRMLGWASGAIDKLFHWDMTLILPASFGIPALGWVAQKAVGLFHKGAGETASRWINAPLKLLHATWGDLSGVPGAKTVGGVIGHGVQGVADASEWVADRTGISKGMEWFHGKRASVNERKLATVAGNAKAAAEKINAASLPPSLKKLHKAALSGDATKLLNAYDRTAAGTLKATEHSEEFLGKAREAAKAHKDGNTKEAQKLFAEAKELAKQVDHKKIENTRLAKYIEKVQNATDVGAMHTHVEKADRFIGRVKTLAEKTPKEAQKAAGKLVAAAEKAATTAETAAKHGTSGKFWGGADKVKGVAEGLAKAPIHATLINGAMIAGAGISTVVDARESIGNSSILKEREAEMQGTDAANVSRIGTMVGTSAGRWEMARTGVKGLANAANMYFNVKMISSSQHNKNPILGMAMMALPFLGTQLVSSGADWLMGDAAMKAEEAFRKVYKTGHATVADYAQFLTALNPRLENLGAQHPVTMAVAEKMVQKKMNAAAMMKLRDTHQLEKFTKQVITELKQAHPAEDVPSHAEPGHHVNSLNGAAPKRYEAVGDRKFTGKMADAPLTSLVPIPGRP